MGGRDGVKYWDPGRVRDGGRDSRLTDQVRGATEGKKVCNFSNMNRSQNLNVRIYPSVE